MSKLYDQAILEAAVRDRAKALVRTRGYLRDLHGQLLRSHDPAERLTLHRRMLIIAAALRMGLPARIIPVR